MRARSKIYFGVKLVSKGLDFSLGQDEIRFENGAYTLVREYFEPDYQHSPRARDPGGVQNQF